MQQSMLCRRSQLGGASGSGIGRGSVEMQQQQLPPPADTSNTSADTAMLLRAPEASVALTDIRAVPSGSEARAGHLGSSYQDGLDSSHCAKPR